ncbi:MAG: YciI family protein [Actinomycetota bacterium]
MRYLLLLYSAETAGPAPGTPEHAAEMQQWFAYSSEMAEAGVMQAAEPLHGIDTATTVCVRDERTLTTDGPFAETKEVLGGFYLIDVEDLDAATAWAAKAPSAAYGSVEVRPILEIDVPG